MPYAPEHRVETRSRILDSARRLFNRNGLAAISIDEIMAGAGLTRGGFYSYFDSKEELYAEAIMHFVNGGHHAAWQRRRSLSARKARPWHARSSMRISLARISMTSRAVAPSSALRPMWRVAVKLPSAPIAK